MLGIGWIILIAEGYKNGRNKNEVYRMIKELIVQGYEVKMWKGYPTGNNYFGRRVCYLVNDLFTSIIK